MVSTWDKKKNKANKLKHGISFEEAQEVFDDPLHLSKLDRRFDYLEERWISIGMNQKDVLVVGHLYTLAGDEEIFKILSARKATPNERRQYETIRKS